MRTLTLTHRGRKHTLFARSDKPGSPLYLQFRDATDKRRTKSLGTSDDREAKANAKAILNAVAVGRWDDVRHIVEGRRPSTAGPVLTVGEAIDKFVAEANWVRKRTRRDYAASLLHLASTALGFKPETTRKVSVGRLTGPVLTRWQAAYVGVSRVELTFPYKKSTGCNSVLRQARAVFSRRSLDAFGWTKPALLDVRFLREPDHSYDPIPEEAINRLTAALPALREADEALWATNGLIRLLGLRASEVARAKREWVIESGDDVFLRVGATAGEAAPKRGSGSVRVGPGPLRDYLVSVPAGRHIIDAPNATERYNTIYRRHSAWVREFVPNRTKTNHELRKHAGSLVAKKTNSFEKAAAFLRIDIETAKRHYLALLDTTDVVLDDGDWL